MLPLTVKTESPAGTEALGKRLAHFLKPGDVVALEGEWGAGKTVFTKGLMRGLGVRSKREVKSPSFVILRHYKGKYPCHHFDLYRLKGIRDLENIGFEEYVFSDGVTVIEWADRVRKHLPKGCLVIKIKIRGESSREFKFSGKPEVAKRIKLKRSKSR
ncbi:MAG: tRNA (adenosine(37)-N6)-threonylcarbamoyltransferase complex ATPase subunit type 1 TsaE [Candidatus Omnitrophica bacterium]|nr:tRNA (adenosine(37)-N6)-threonylcarbamoyltransferase complex ATPase subunit type 1 TsaE [Candidatus Omnitrophota bacterium]